MPEHEPIKIIPPTIDEGLDKNDPTGIGDSPVTRIPISASAPAGTDPMEHNLAPDLLVRTHIVKPDDYVEATPSNSQQIKVVTDITVDADNARFVVSYKTITVSNVTDEPDGYITGLKCGSVVSE